MCEVLIRLWNVSPKNLRRVISFEHERSLSNYVSGNVEQYFPNFPAHLQKFVFKGVRPTIKDLRARPHTPIATGHIPWHSNWTAKWAGSETDLFYIFVKNYIEIASRMLPDRVEFRMAAPTWAIVHSHLLVVLDRTLQRPDALYSTKSMQKQTAATTLNGILGEVDEPNLAASIPAHKTYRSMAENRIIMLIRDSLSCRKVSQVLSSSLRFWIVLRHLASSKT